jgi:uncharacterized protein YqeY
MLQEDIKQMVRDKNTSKDTKSTLRVLLGEFGRVNDGKSISDEQCISVIKKFIKNIDESLNHIGKTLPEIREKLKIERNLMSTFLPKSATLEQMKKSIDKIMKENEFKNNMQAMKPVIEDLESQGVNIDKKKLSELIKKY